jgi:hypothetical protein
MGSPERRDEGSMGEAAAAGIDLEIRLSRQATVRPPRVQLFPAASPSAWREEERRQARRTGCASTLTLFDFTSPADRSKALK